MEFLLADQYVDRGLEPNSYAPGPLLLAFICRNMAIKHFGDELLTLFWDEHEAMIDKIEYDHELDFVEQKVRQAFEEVHHPARPSESAAPSVAGMSSPSPSPGNPSGILSETGLDPPKRDETLGVRPEHPSPPADSPPAPSPPHQRVRRLPGTPLRRRLPGTPLDLPLAPELPSFSTD